MSNYTIVDTGQAKCYSKAFSNGQICQMFVQYVRGNPQYGKNNFHDHADNTITDKATGPTWQKSDSCKGLNWQQALAYAADYYLAGYHDWRLPNAKELQSIVDYSQVPAIDPIFQISKLSDGEHPFYWTSTTDLDDPIEQQGCNAVYLCFGRALGWMQLPPTADHSHSWISMALEHNAAILKSATPHSFHMAVAPKATSSASITTSASCAVASHHTATQPPNLSMSTHHHP